MPWVLFTGKGLNKDLHGWKRGSPRPPEGGCARSCRSEHQGGEGQRLGEEGRHAGPSAAREQRLVAENDVEPVAKLLGATGGKSGGGDGPSAAGGGHGAGVAGT